MSKERESYKILMVIIGGFIFAAGVNLFIVPLDLYSGGVIGVAQIIRTVLIDYIHLPLSKEFDVAGIINFAMNIPLFIMAYRVISRKFFIKTLFCVIAQTLAFSFILIPKDPIIDDVLASCLIGGVITGFGIGLALRSGGSGGGLDILGIYFARKFANFSVGKLNLIVNAVVYFICAMLFSLPTAIYSILYMVCFSMMLDRTHYQNINMTATIFTKNKEIQKAIMSEMGRGVTYWDGAGAYTDSETRILVTVINKYEEEQLRKIIDARDPRAFIIFNEGPSVSGNFEKRL